MKKKILLMLSLMLLAVCLFAISVNAQGSQENTYGTATVIEGIDTPTTIDTASLVVLKASDGTYYTFPSYYIVADQETFRWKQNAEVSAMLGYTQSNANNDFRPYIVRMQIPEGIKSINPGSEGGAYAFEDSASMVEVTIPSTMTKIGNYSFNRCEALVTVNGFDAFMQRATKLGNYMLSQTLWGENFDLVIPSTITVVPEGCFKGTKIKSVTFHSEFTGIEKEAFQNCLNLTQVKLPASLTYLKKHVFAACSNLEAIDLSECTKLQEIGDYCFEKTKITNFDFTVFVASMTSIGKGLFNECKSLATVSGYGLVLCATEVGENMFNSCPVTELELPPNITKIGVGAFKGCAITGYINVPDTVTEISSNGFFGATKITGVSLPRGLTRISNHAFAGCSNLASVDTSKVTALAYIGRYSFEYCTSLTSFDFTPFASSLVTLEIDGGNNGMFNGCTNLVSVTGFENASQLTQIPGKTFNACPLTEIKLPQNIESIGSEAFKGHRSTQTELRIPNGVTSIGDHAFQRGVTGGAESVKIYLSANLTTISGNYTFERWHYTEMYIPASLTSLVEGFCHQTLSQGVVYYFTGDINGFTIHATNNAAMNNAEWIKDADFTGASSEKNYIVYGYNVCEAFYMNEHIGNASVTFTGEKFISNAKLYVDCTRCLENAFAKEVTPLITNLGWSYSMFEEGGYSIIQEFKFDMEVMDFYKEYCGVSSHGLVAAINTYNVDGEEKVFNDGNLLSLENGEVVSNKSAMADLSKETVGHIYMKIVGITEKYYDAKLFCCSFLVANGTIYYFNSNSVYEGTVKGSKSFTEISGISKVTA